TSSSWTPPELASSGWAIKTSRPPCQSIARHLVERPLRVRTHRSSVKGPVIDSISVVSLCGSACCAVLLHLAPDRPHAAGVVPIALAWGALAVALAGRSRDRTPLGLVLLALAVRAPLVGTPTLLSDDLYRYLWEGLALGAGHDVFREAP